MTDEALAIAAVICICREHGYSFSYSDPIDGFARYTVKDYRGATIIETVHLHDVVLLLEKR